MMQHGSVYVGMLPPVMLTHLLHPPTSSSTARYATYSWGRSGSL